MSRKTQKQLVLERLQRGPASSDDLNAICFRYSARIHELRNEGYRIKARPLTENLFEFTLQDYHDPPTQLSTDFLEGYDRAQQFSFGDLLEHQKRVLLEMLAETRKRLGPLPNVKCAGPRPRYRTEIDQKGDDGKSSTDGAARQ